MDDSTDGSAQVRLMHTTQFQIHGSGDGLYGNNLAWWAVHRLIGPRRAVAAQDDRVAAAESRRLEVMGWGQRGYLRRLWLT